MPYRLISHQELLADPGSLLPGDFVVTHGSGPLDVLIQIATRSHWNHAALVTTADGEIVELVGQGIQRATIGKYAPAERYIVRIEDFSDEDRRHIVAYAAAMLRRHDRYGWPTIATIALKIVTGSRLIVKLDGTMICSEFVAKALAEGGQIWEEDTALITPADLYNRYVREQLAS